MDALGKHNNTLGVAPTGAGKTVMLSAVVVAAMERGAERVAILQHRDELVEQNRRTFHALAGMSVSSGVINAERKDWQRPVQFAMVPTLARNLGAMQPVDLIVTDEAHHSAAASYLKIYERARELNPDVAQLGVTATPNRGDKKALRGIYDNVADQITLAELIRSGHLVRPRTFVIDLGVNEELAKVRRTVADFDMTAVARILDHQVLNRQVVEKWREVAGDRQTAAFCSTVEHATHVTEAFAEAGITARMVTGEMPDGERRALIRSFDRAEFQVVVNVAVLTEGWDCQAVSCVVLLRPSSYQSTMIQMIGRGLRRLDPERYPGRAPKLDCIVLDFGTSVITHGSLEQDIDLEPYKAEPKMVDCPECGAEIPASSRECAICGHVMPREESDRGAGGSAVGQDGQPIEFILTEIDIFAQSPFRWETLWDGAVYLATAFDAWAAAVFYQGTWHVFGGHVERGVHYLLAGEKMLCLAAGDDWMREHGDKQGAAKSKRWLHLPATEKQLQLLGMDPRSVALTRYEAACFLTWKFNSNGMRKKLESVGAAVAA
jgi:superfamily II DNA or RNA helicase